MLKSGDDHHRIHDQLQNGTGSRGSPSLPESPSPFHLRELKESFGSSRTNDDVHRSIQLCPLTISVLDTPHMQRLRGLKQLGVSEMTYIPTTHSRFEHSLGVAALAEKVLREIARKQPRLDISEKDIVCVKLAGLLHDIGHGPYSHVYDGTFRKELKKAEKSRMWLGERFEKRAYDGLPEVMDGWEHEDGSLMMIDDLLKHLGLEIDENRLDEPLKQIGDGIRAESFGIRELVFKKSRSDLGYGNEHEMNGHGNHSHSTNTMQERIDPLTSRDWIFIKECIVGGPLPPKGVSVGHAQKQTYPQPQSFVGRPSIYQEFLYDVVSNRHSGLDVDKMDYLARDDRRAFGSSGQIDPMFIENAHVAWGACARPMKCFRCKYFHNGNIKISASSQRGDDDCNDNGEEQNREGQHLMICYPEKMVQNAMSFFKSRFANHQKLYTHHKTNAACYMVCDIMLLADQYFRISTKNEGDGTTPPGKVNEEVEKAMSLPISRANVHPRSYLLLKDSVLDLIAASPMEELCRARMLINRFRSHKLYKKVAEQPIVSKNGKDVDIPWQRNLWSMSEPEIAKSIFKCGQLRSGLGTGHQMLQIEHIIVEKRQIHHGMGAENPVSAMRFLPKSQLSKLREAPKDLPTAVEIEENTYECSIPRAFLQRTLRIYCRKYDRDLCDFLITCYYQFIENLKKQSNGIAGVYGGDPHIQEGERNVYMAAVPNVLSQSPARCSNDSFAVSMSMNMSNSSFNGHRDRDEEPNEGGSRKRRKSLFAHLKDKDDWDSP